MIVYIRKPARTLELRVVAYCNKGYKEEVHTFTNALNGLLCFAAARTQLKHPLLTQVSSSFITALSVLYLQKQSDTREDRTTKASYKFNLERVSLLLANGTDLSYLHVIRSQVGKRKAIKSRKSGLVSLGKKDDCGYWIRITATTSGN